VTRYLSVAEVVAINAEVVRKFGGTHAIRDAGLLDSAVARPQSGYYAHVFEEAAALFESLSQNHPFVDGQAHRHYRYRRAPSPERLQIAVQRPGSL
jgi:death-on-curing protein